MEIWGDSSPSLSHSLAVTHMLGSPASSPRVQCDGVLAPSEIQNRQAAPDPSVLDLLSREARAWRARRARLTPAGLRKPQEERGVCTLDGSVPSDREWIKFH